MRSLRALLAVAAAMSCAAAVHAQSSDETYAGIEINYGSPGARSLGLGGAFIGLADDATAAHTNPAGLVNISRPQITVEGRFLSYTNSFTSRGHAFGDPTGIGNDTVPGIVEDEQLNRVFTPSFLSLVYPHHRWAVALYRHELANFRSSALTEGPFYQNESGNTARLPPTRSALDLRIVNYGVSVAFRLAEPLTVGLTVAQQNFKLVSQTNRYRNPVFGPVDYGVTTAIVTQHGEGRGTAVHAGVQYDLTRGLRIAAAYRRQSGYRLDVRTHLLVAGRIDPSEARFNVPQVYSVGIGYKPGSNRLTTVTFDVNHILYSQLTKGFVPLDGEPNLYSVPDGEEYRLGVERRLFSELFGNRSIAIRLGAWRDPDHRIRYSGPLRPESLLFRAGDAEYHVTAGIGVSLGGRFQLDSGYDYSRRQRSFSASVTNSF